jgi:hypothetical protein
MAAFDLTVYRGQKHWKEGDPILASSLRRCPRPELILTVRGVGCKFAET